MESWDLDVLGQRPGSNRLYTQLCFYFPITNVDVGRQEGIIRHLIRGLEKLTAEFPWVAGQVVKTASGRYSMCSHTRVPQLVCQDLRSTLPSFQEYQVAGFSFRLMDETIIAARNTLPERHDEPAPVFMLQANFVEGGLLLVFSAQHNCMDMRGQAQMIHLFSKACRDEPPTDEEERIGNIPRKSIIPLVSPNNSETSLGDSKNHYTVKPASSSRPKAVWAYFSFASDALAALKRTAEVDKQVEYISTDDTVSALIWQSIAHARLSRIADPSSTPSNFARQVDTRQHLGLPSSYPGVVVHKVSSTATIEELVHEALGVTASRLRRALQEKDLGYQTRLAATKLHGMPPDQQTDGGSSSQDLSTHIVMSSWAKERCCDYDFGGALGKPAAVRRPRFEAWEGLAYLMPKCTNGDIVAALCLREEDLERLTLDTRFGEYAWFIG